MHLRYVYYTMMYCMIVYYVLPPHCLLLLSITAFLADPFSREWRYKFQLDGDFLTHIKSMIGWYVPLDNDGGSKTREAMQREFLVSVSH